MTEGEFNNAVDILSNYVCRVYFSKWKNSKHENIDKFDKSDLDVPVD